MNPCFPVFVAEDRDRWSYAPGPFRDIFGPDIVPLFDDVEYDEAAGPRDRARRSQTQADDRSSAELPVVGTWHRSALCVTAGVDMFTKFSDQARHVCHRCPVRVDCLAEALRIEAAAGLSSIHGVRGGMSATHRWFLVDALIAAGARHSIDDIAVVAHLEASAA